MQLDANGKATRVGFRTEDGKKVRFGARGYSDFTLHGDPKRMMRYVVRHGGTNTAATRNSEIFIPIFVNSQPANTFPKFPVGTTKVVDSLSSDGSFNHAYR